MHTWSDVWIDPIATTETQDRRYAAQFAFLALPNYRLPFSEQSGEFDSFDKWLARRYALEASGILSSGEADISDSGSEQGSSSGREQDLRSESDSELEFEKEKLALIHMGGGWRDNGLQYMMTHDGLITAVPIGKDLYSEVVRRSEDNHMDVRQRLIKGENVGLPGKTCVGVGSASVVGARCPDSE